MTSSLKMILEGAIDYAGVFPPVSAGMATAMHDYAGYLSGPRAWALGRLVVPASSLEEFNFHIPEIETTEDARLIRLSVLVGDDVDACFGRIRAFNRWHAERDGRVKAVVESVEIKAAFTETVSRVSEAARGLAGVFFEIPIEQEPAELVRAIARVGGAVKVRTGGAAPRMVPPAQWVIRFLDACLGAGVRFKATGGLRQPLSGFRVSTSRPGDRAGSSRTMTYGFINLFLCAAFMYDGLGSDEALPILTEESADAFTFDDEGVAWRSGRIAADALAGFRRNFAVSFGSASFEEPLDRLRELDLA